MVCVEIEKADKYKTLKDAVLRIQKCAKGYRNPYYHWRIGSDIK